MRHFSWKAFFAIAAVLLTSSVALASPKSEALDKQGIAALRKSQYVEAERLFHAAFLTDPRDNRAAFLRGYALNRLGRPAMALASLEYAQLGGIKGPPLDYELGWAAVETGRWQMAVDHLKRYEKAKPGIGKVSEFLGRAYLGLGQLDQAEAKLKEAMGRNPKLSETVRLYLAAIYQRQGNQDAARQTADALFHEAPKSRISAVLRNTMRQAALARQREKKYALTVLGGVGFNDNVIGVDGGVPLPSGITGRKSGFVRAGVDGAFRLYRDKKRQLTVGYTYQRDRYFDTALQRYDVSDHYPHIDGQLSLAPDLVAGLQVGDELTYVGGKKFRQAYGGRLSLDWHAYSWAVAEGAVELQHMNYSQQPPFAVENRTGNAGVFSMTAYLTPPNRLGIRGRIGWSHRSTNTKGADFDYTSDAIQLGASMPLPWKIKGALSYSHSFDRYDHLNSFAGPVGNGFKRSDDVDLLSLQLTRPIAGPVSAYGRYDYVNESSNINVYRYVQNEISAGLIARF